MEPEDFVELLTPAGQLALDEAQALQPRELDFLRHFTALSRRYPAGLARAALETAILRREAQSKFPLAGRMYFTREALEQASAHAVSSYRAQRYAGFERVADLGCSVGGDTLALAQAARVIGVDLEPLRLAMASVNLGAAGLGAQASFVQADLAATLPFAASEGTALFFDPARRSAGRRVFSVRDYRPPLEVVHAWQPDFPALGVKVSPGVDWRELAPFDAEVEFISLGGELKEAALWFGPLKRTGRQATLLPGPHVLSASGRPGEPGGEPGLPVSPPRAYLYEPDPAVLRAGLVQHLGAQLGAAQLDPDIAYLTADRRVETPFARSWAVEDWFPFQLKRLRAWLRERRVGRVVVKKRGSPIQPEALIRDLRLSQEAGSSGRVLFLTHWAGKPVVVVCFEEGDDR